MHAPRRYARTPLLLLPLLLAALAGCQDRELPTAASALRPGAPALQIGISTTPGSLVSWGRNESNQVTDTPSGTGFTAVAAGAFHSVALRADGSLVSWGWNGFNQVSATPSGTGFTAVAAGYWHNVALRADGSLVSWGDNGFNQVSATPSGPGFTAVAAGDFHSVAIQAPPAPSGFVFSGFFAPVDNLPTINVAKAGSANPVKFSLGGDQGLNIFASGYPRSQAITCDAAAPLGPVEETVTAGNSSLSYDALTDTYTYVWKTERSWRNSCRTLTVQFTDGTTHSASFRFTK